MNGQMLQSTVTEKDLGVLITSDLKSGEQCAAAYMKANKMLGLIKRTLVGAYVEIEKHFWHCIKR